MSSKPGDKPRLLLDALALQPVPMCQRWAHGGPPEAHSLFCTVRAPLSSTASAPTMISCPNALVVAVVLLAGSAAAITGAPIVKGVEQVHLALGKAAGSMTVAWASGSDVADNVTYHTAGPPAGKTMTAVGDSRPLNIAGSRYTHVATMTGLIAGKRCVVASNQVLGSGHVPQLQQPVF